MVEHVAIDSDVVVGTPAVNKVVDTVVDMVADVEADMALG